MPGRETALLGDGTLPGTFLRGSLRMSIPAARQPALCTHETIAVTGTQPAEASTSR